MADTDILISFFYEDIEFKLDNEDALTDWLSGIFEAEGKQLDFIEYIFCSDEYLLAINQQYLNHDYYTDIITFPLSDDPISATIFISIDRVKDNANQYSKGFLHELHRVMAHGVLHLIGYNDKTDDEVKEMRAKEDDYILLLMKKHN